MTNTVTACNTVNLLDKATYDQQTPADTELWAVDEESDSNYKGMVAGWAMPSTRTEAVTVGASGAEYTAPANGWFSFKTTNTATQNNYTYLNNISANVFTYSMANAAIVASGFVPVKKGEKAQLVYVNSIISEFRFIYAEGDKDV